MAADGCGRLHMTRWPRVAAHARLLEPVEEEVLREVELEDGDYTMDHTASILLLDSDGDFFGTIAYEENSETAIAKLKRLANET